MRVFRPAPALAAVAFSFFAVVPAQAVSNRIFMSTNGNNASDCANPLTPCLTFAGALAQVNPEARSSRKRRADTEPSTSRRR